MLVFLACALAVQMASAAPNDVLLVDLPGAIGSTTSWASFTGGYTAASGEIIARCNGKARRVY